MDDWRYLIHGDWAHDAVRTQHHLAQQQRIVRTASTYSRKLETFYFCALRRKLTHAFICFDDICRHVILYTNSLLFVFSFFFSTTASNSPHPLGRNLYIDQVQLFSFFFFFNKKQKQMLFNIIIHFFYVTIICSSLDLLNSNSHKEVATVLFSYYDGNTNIITIMATPWPSLQLQHQQ